MKIILLSGHIVEFPADNRISPDLTPDDLEKWSGVLPTVTLRAADGTIIEEWTNFFVRRGSIIAFSADDVTPVELEV